MSGSQVIPLAMLRESLRTRAASADRPIAALVRASRPRDPDAHLFESSAGWHALLSDGSRVFDIDAALVARAGEVGAAAALREAGAVPLGFIGDEPPSQPPLRALSLAVVQACNLGCGYCYAGGGDFGGKSKMMQWDVARAAVDRLLAESGHGAKAHLAFMGGEPLLARKLIRRVTQYANERASQQGVRLGFSITSNGTLLTPEDAEFFERHAFSVTLSLDGIGEAHDRQRPFKNGAPSYSRIIERARPLLQMQRAMQVSARVTVTPNNLDLQDTLDTLVDLGFHSVGFSPLLRAHDRSGEITSADVERLLDAMVACGDEFLRRLRAGRRYPFSNLSSALSEIHKGTHRPYACGAGAGYLGASATGDLFACHRFVEDPRAAMGTVHDGVDRIRQADWLAQRHVHRQQPCAGCWARYLCGGGCHHEVIARGRPACDYIRGWLLFCLRTYIEVLQLQPDFFAALDGPVQPTAVA